MVNKMYMSCLYFSTDLCKKYYKLWINRLLIVYNELFKLHPYDATLVGVIVPTQNVINV